MLRTALKYCLLTAILCIGLAPAARADEITIGLDDVYSGGTPLGSAPWVTLDFKDYGPNEVLLTLTASDLVSPEFITEIAFNFNPNKVLSDLSFSLLSGVKDSSISVSQNHEFAGPIHTFDIAINYPDSNSNKTKRFGHGSTTEILIKDSNASQSLSALDFDYSTFFHTESVTAAAKVQGIPGCDSSAWIGGDSVTILTAAVPEPSSMFLMGLGVVGVGLGRWRKTRKAG